MHYQTGDLATAKRGGAGHDALSDWRPSNSQEGRAGHDALSDWRPSNSQEGGAGHDALSEWRPSNSQEGRAGHDALSDWRPSNSQEGGAGHDALSDWRPSNSQEGGAGHDANSVVLYKLSNATHPLSPLPPTHNLPVSLACCWVLPEELAAVCCWGTTTTWGKLGEGNSSCHIQTTLST